MGSAVPLYARTHAGPLVYTLGAGGDPRGRADDGDRASWWLLAE